MWSNGDGCICGVLTPEVDPCIWCIRNYCLIVSHRVNKCSVALDYTKDMNIDVCF